MADAQTGNTESTSTKETSNLGTPQNTTSEGALNGNSSTHRSFNHQMTPFSRSQEPWNVLLFWMSAQYYQQYYYQLFSYMYYWQTLASHSMYQGSIQAQGVYPQTGVHQQGSQPVFGGQQPQNIQQNNRPAPWAFQGQQMVRTGRLGN